MAGGKSGFDVAATGVILGEMRWKFDCVDTCAEKLGSTVQSANGPIRMNWDLVDCRELQRGLGTVPLGSEAGVESSATN